MKITTWNVNSIRRRIDAVLTWTERNRPEVLCLQETRCVEGRFPWVGFEGLGYTVRVVGQKGQNGVAIVSRLPMSDVVANPVNPLELPARSIAATIACRRLLNVYVPHGDDVGSDGYRRKLEWLDAFARTLCCGAAGRPAVVSGDFNVAPDDRDVYDPSGRREKLVCSRAERAAFRGLLEAGYVDAFRECSDEPGHYTWWSHRAGALRSNHGLRVDHHLVAISHRNRIRNVAIDRAQREQEGASDHAPLTLEID